MSNPNNHRQSPSRPSVRATQPRPIHTYNNGSPYRSAAGRGLAREAVHRHRFSGHPIVQGFPSGAEFIKAVNRELKIRAYRRNTRTSYISNLTKFLRWFGGAPHQVVIEDVRNFLEVLVDGGASSSTLSGHLSSIRTAFDKLCGRDVTLGLATPRRQKRQPVILSAAEVQRIIAAAPRINIKLAIGIMYAAGLRNGELCRLRVRDLDFDRRTIRVYQGKGQTDRTVLLPRTFEATLRELCSDRQGTDYLFPSGRRSRSSRAAGRHMSPRTLQRWVVLSVDLAGLKKRVTPHSFRHAFATHLLENGTDIRYIQKLLGHARLETTTIYTRVAQVRSERIVSPLDQLPNNQKRRPSARVDSAGDSGSESAGDWAGESASDSSNQPQRSVGTLRFDLKRIPGRSAVTVQLHIMGARKTVLAGIEAFQNDQNWIEIRLPASNQWRSAIESLPSQQRARIQSPEFYELIRREISKRALLLLQSGGPSEAPPPPPR